MKGDNVCMLNNIWHILTALFYFSNVSRLKMTICWQPVHQKTPMHTRTSPTVWERHLTSLLFQKSFLKTRPRKSSLIQPCWDWCRTSSKARTAWCSRTVSPARARPTRFRVSVLVPSHVKSLLDSARFAFNPKSVSL